MKKYLLLFIVVACVLGAYAQEVKHDTLYIAYKKQKKVFKHFEIGAAVGEGYNFIPKPNYGYSLLSSTFDKSEWRFNEYLQISGLIYVSPHVFIGIQYSKTGMGYAADITSKYASYYNIADDIDYYGITSGYNFCINKLSVTAGAGISYYLTNRDTASGSPYAVTSKYSDYSVRNYPEFVGLSTSVYGTLKYDLYKGITPFVQFIAANDLTLSLRTDAKNPNPTPNMNTIHLTALLGVSYRF